MDTRKLVWLSIPAALLSLSCGDADPPPAEGAVTVSIKNSGSSTSGYACGPSHTLTLAGLPPTASDTGASWVDGQEGHTVSCSVSGSGTFTFNGDISGNAANFRVSGSATQGASSAGSVALFDPNLQIAMSDSNCTVRVDGSYKVENGSIFAAVSCSNLMNPNDDKYLWCAADAIFAFRNCK